MTHTTNLYSIMITMCAKDLPPPIRKPKRRLSLKTAIETMSRSESAIGQPLLDPIGEFPTATEDQYLEIETNLVKMQADIIIREGLLSDKEKALQNHERELNERQALLEAHEKIIQSLKRARKSSPSGNPVNAAERKAFEALKRELKLQEDSLKDARTMLQEREDYIEQCENQLVEKSMQLTEREAYIEQREENHEAKVFFDNKQNNAQAS